MPDNLRKRLEELTLKQEKGTLPDEDKPRLRRLKHIERLFTVRAEVKDRMRTLEQKAKSGSLTPEERNEYERMRERDARFAELAKQDRQRNSTRKQRIRDAKRRLLQEFPGIVGNAAAAAEYQKHAERMSQLDRAMEVAVASQNAAATGRVEQLRGREQARHQNWIAKQNGTERKLAGR